MAQKQNKAATQTKAEPSGKDVKKAAKKGGRLTFYTVLVTAAFVAPFMLPTLVLVILGLIPTFFAAFVDRDRQQSTAIAIGAMNFAGLTPFVLDLWVKGQSMGNVMQILRDPSTWLITFGAAGIGKLIVSVIPPAVATLSLAHSELRIMTLKKNLEQLRESWGPDVGSTKPLDRISPS